MKHKPIYSAILGVSALLSVPAILTAGETVPSQEKTANPYELAQRFAGSKLRNMLFSTTVDPHWFKSGNKFWYSYKTGEGTDRKSVV